MTTIELAQMHSEMVGETGKLARAYLRACEALKEINRYNHINNDLQAYLFAIAEWGISGDIDRPQPDSYGITPP